MGRPKVTDRIVEGLLRRVVSGHWQPGMALPSGRRLAEELGVSLPTMQAALTQVAGYGLLNIHPRGPMVVLPGAVETAQRRLDELRAQPAFRRLAIIVPDIYMPLEKKTEENRYYARVAQAVIREAAKKNIQASVIEWPLLTQVAFAQQIRVKGYGIALALGAIPEYLVSLHEMSRMEFPVLLHNRAISWLNLPTVFRDDHGASWRIAQMFFLRGHRNMCMVAPLSHGSFLSYRRNRISGWLDFLKESELLESCDMPVFYVQPGYDLRHVLNHVFGYKGGPTAVLFTSDGLAESVFRDKRYAKIRIPDEVSVATFGSAVSLRQTSWRRQLTTIQVNFGRMAECTIEMVERMLGGDLNPPSIRVSLDIKLTASLDDAPATG